LIYGRRRQIWERSSCLYLRMCKEKWVRIRGKGDVMVPRSCEEKWEESHVSHGERAECS